MCVPTGKTRAPPLTAGKSFKLGFEFVLQEDRQETEESEHHQQQDSLHCDGVHGGGQLLQGRPRLDEDEGGRSHAKESPNPERQQWDSDDGRDDIYKPASSHVVCCPFTP